MRSRVVGTGLVLLALGPPATYAIAQAPSEPAPSPSLPAAACPQATEAFAKAGLNFEAYIPSCPDPGQVGAAISSYRQNLAEFRAVGTAGEDATPGAE